ncbi:mitotic interactor and substrate of PLK1 isoform X1 [Xenopus tropicalis]|uniref:Mitotic interactor and substrate of PLK1 isoform X1 n=2 Tax=Xenopus tropicalis TaxID=8364 RepID=A0A6I8REZ9_XENTR|nr:mitotic interactor and substrate of PLK1 isoform X1 [Xenopus tropicalis]
MFKYPAPWQVLCSGLERRDVISNEEKAKSLYLNDTSHSQTEVPTGNISDLHSTNSFGLQLTNSPKDQTVGLPEQGKNDFETQAVILTEFVSTRDEETRYENELQVTDKEKKTFLEENRFFSQDINYTSEVKEPNTSKPQRIEVPISVMDRITRSSIYSLSSAKDTESCKEEAGQETNSTAQHSPRMEGRSMSRDVWVPHPERDSQLRLLKEDKRFDIRAYRSQTSPTKLFTDDDSEDEFRPRSRDLTPEKLLELDAQRKDIIKRQGQRKSLDMEELRVSLDETGSSTSGVDINGLDNRPNTDQINFEAARQQFLMLEKKKENLPLPSPQVHSKLTRLSSQIMLENDNINQGKTGDIPRKVWDIVSPNSESQPISSRSRSSSQLYNNISGEIYADNVDSKAEEKPSNYQITEEELDDIPNPSNETPIEREIRLAKEREENLRRERGIQISSETNEIVEILKNPVVPFNSNVPSQKKSKDRARTSIFLQREIEKEAQREADLKNEGKVAGLYDKGSAQEIDERRKLFEQPDDISVKPQYATTKTIFKGTINSYSTGDDITQVDFGEPNEKNNDNSQDSQLPYSVRTNWKPTPMNTYRYRRQSLENILDSKPSSESSILHKENAHVKPLESHLSVKEDEDEDEKRKQLFDRKTANPEAIYSVNRLRPSLSNIIEQEIKQTLERDRELKEQRRRSEVASITSPVDIQTPVPVNGYTQYERPILTSGFSNQWSPAPHRANPGTPSYILSEEQTFKLKRYPKFVATESDSDQLRKYGEDSWYAGIDPTDDVNTEIVESTRVNRHKNRMAMRWEAGLYANESSD